MSAVKLAILEKELQVLKHRMDEGGSGGGGGVTSPRGGGGVSNAVLEKTVAKHLHNELDKIKEELLGDLKEHQKHELGKSNAAIDQSIALEEQKKQVEDLKSTVVALKEEIQAQKLPVVDEKKEESRPIYVEIETVERMIRSALEKHASPSMETRTDRDIPIDADGKARFDPDIVTSMICDALADFNGKAELMVQDALQANNEQILQLKRQQEVEQNSSEIRREDVSDMIRQAVQEAQSQFVLEQRAVRDLVYECVQESKAVTKTDVQQMIQLAISSNPDKPSCVQRDAVIDMMWEAPDTMHRGIEDYVDEDTVARMIKAALSDFHPVVVADSSDFQRQSVKDIVKTQMSEIQLAQMIKDETRREEEAERNQEIDNRLNEIAKVLSPLQQELRDTKDSMDAVRKEKVDTWQVVKDAEMRSKELRQEEHQEFEEKMGQFWSKSQLLEEHLEHQFENQEKRLLQICAESEAANVVNMEKTLETWDKQFEELLQYCQEQAEDQKNLGRRLEELVEPVREENEKIRLKLDSVTKNWETKLSSFMQWVREPVADEKHRHEDLRLKMQTEMANAMSTWKEEVAQLQEQVAKQGKELLQAENMRAQLMNENTEKAINFEEAYNLLMTEAKVQAEQLAALNGELSKGRQELDQQRNEWSARVQAWQDQLKDLSHQVEEQTEELIAAHQAVKQAKESALKAMEDAEAVRDQAIEEKKEAIREKEMAFDECVEFVKERNEASRRAAQESINAARKDRDLFVRSVQQKTDEQLRRVQEEKELQLREKEKEIEEIAQMMQVRDAAARKAAREAIAAAECERDQVIKEKKQVLTEYERKLKESEAAARKAARDAILVTEAAHDRKIIEKQADFASVQSERDMEIQQAKAETDRIMKEKEDAIAAYEEKMKESMRASQVDRERVMSEGQAAMEQLEKMIKERDAAVKQLKESRFEVDRMSATVSAVTHKDVIDLTHQIQSSTTEEEAAAEARDAGDDSICK